MCAEISACSITLNTAPKVEHNPPVMLDMSMVTWIFSSLDASLKISTDPNPDYSRMIAFFIITNFHINIFNQNKLAKCSQTYPKPTYINLV